jgi:hypothetical protein
MPVVFAVQNSVAAGQLYSSMDYNLSSLCLEPTLAFSISTPRDCTPTETAFLYKCVANLLTLKAS